MAIVTFTMGFFQDGIGELVSGKIVPELHVDGLLFGLLSTIGLLALLVYYYYIKRLDITKKISSQPLMKSIHTLLFNGYFVEFFIHYFSKNIVVGSFAKTINWIDTNIIDKTVNNTKIFAQNIKMIFMKTHTSYTTDNSGAMLFGIIALFIAFLAGGVM